VDATGAVVAVTSRGPDLLTGVRTSARAVTRCPSGLGAGCDTVADSQGEDVLQLADSGLLVTQRTDGRRLVRLAGTTATLPAPGGLKAKVLESDRAQGTWIDAADLRSPAATTNVAFGYSTNAGQTWGALARYYPFYPSTALPYPSTLYDTTLQPPNLGVRGTSALAVNLSARRAPPRDLLAVIGPAATRAALYLVGADARFSHRTLAVSARTCSAADTLPSCRPPPGPALAACVPDPHQLASACVAVVAPLDQAVLVRSADDGTSFSPAVSVDPAADLQGEQTLAHDLAVAADGTVAIVYERESRLKVGRLLAAPLTPLTGGAL
jgi:hypothetical protein